MKNNKLSRSKNNQTKNGLFIAGALLGLLNYTMLSANEIKAKETAIKDSSTSLTNLSSRYRQRDVLRHIDPLDAGRAMASHRGKNPHRNLSADQEIKVALQHYQEDRKPEAMATLGQAIAHYPKAAKLYDVRATLELQSGETSDALADIEKAVELASDNPVYRVNRSQIYLKFHREKEALADLNKAVELNPDLIPARFNRGSLLAYQGKNKAALADFDQCIALNPHLPAPYFNRAAVYKALGKKELALKDLQNFIKIAQNNSWKKSAQDLLKAWNEEKEVAK